MKTTPDHNQEPEQEELLEQTPAAISAQNLGAKFSEEWRRIEKNQCFWRWAVCGGLGLIFLCFFYLAATIAEKWETTVDRFYAIHTHEQNMTQLLGSERAALIGEAAEERKKLEAVAWELKKTHALHARLRNRIRIYLKLHPNAKANFSPELREVRAELNRLDELLPITRTIAKDALERSGGLEISERDETTTRGTP